MISFLEFTTLVGLVLTPAQRVIAMVVYDGGHPRDLQGSDRELARQLFGPDVETIEARARAVFVLLKGARVGGTMIFNALYTLWRALIADLTALAPGERAVGLICAPDLRLARQVLRYVQGALESTPELAGMTEGSTSDSVTIRRDDGRVVEISVLPATRGGSALRSRSLTSAGFTEASFLKDETGIGNDRELVRAAGPRVLRGGVIVLESTPWLEGGLVHELFTLNYNKPTTAIAVRAPTLVMRDDPDTLALVERETERDPVNAQTEFECEFLAAGSGALLDPTSIAACVNKARPLALPPALDLKCFAAGDLAFSGDSSAIVIVRIEGGRLRLVDALEIKPSKGSPLKPSTVYRRFGELMKTHGALTLHADHHNKESAREHLENVGLRFHATEGGANGKLRNYQRAQALVKEGRVEVPNMPRLLQQLREITARPLPGGGTQISHPRRGGRQGGHGDLAAAFVLALSAASGQIRREGRPRDRDRGAASGARYEMRAMLDAPEGGGAIDRMVVSGGSVVIGPPARTRLTMRGGPGFGGQGGF